MGKTTTDLLNIAGTGVNIILDASSKTTTDLINITGVVGRKNGHITLINCSKKTTTDLLNICSIYPSNITLDFTEE